MLEYDKIDINEGIDVNKNKIIIIEILIIKDTYAMVVTICI